MAKKKANEAILKKKEKEFADYKDKIPLSKYKAALEKYESGEIKPPEGRPDLQTKEGEASWRKANIKALKAKIKEMEK